MPGFVIFEGIKSVFELVFDRLRGPCIFFDRGIFCQVLLVFIRVFEARRIYVTSFCVTIEEIVAIIDRITRCAIVFSEQRLLRKSGSISSFVRTNTLLSMVVRSVQIYFKYSPTCCSKSCMWEMMRFR